MLRHGRLFSALALVAALLLWLPVPAHADGGCDQSSDPWCTADGGTGGSGGGNGGGNTGGSGGCIWQGQTVPCQDPQFGRYVGKGCYWKAFDPQPLHSPPAGQDPNKGKWGVMSCYLNPGSGVATQVNYWMPDAVAGPTPAELAQQALAKIHLLGAGIGVAPRTNGSGAVGLPVWLWTAVTPGTWGPLSADASGGGITVTVTAKASRIVWDMGDGGQVSCASPGTPYDAKYGLTPSPTCGYTYGRPSSTAAHPHGRYTVTATTHWTVTWVGGGEAGVLNPTSQSQTSIEIGEIQVVGQ